MKADRHPLHRQAVQMDRADALKGFKKKFHPPSSLGKDSIYLCGNSLGLMPVGAEQALLQECRDWSAFGVEGHWKARHPWLTYHKAFSSLLAPLCGAKREEVVAMNSLTVNLHLALASFYKPDKKRFVILHETQAFSSDLYALESVVKQHGLNPKQSLVGIDRLDTASVLKAIEKNKNRLALVLLGGVNYYSGTLLDMQAITRAAHHAGALAGFDLAHAIGNVPLHLHKWEVDFAVWCSYKYLNAGPGATGGLFVHRKHSDRLDTPRLAGWWGQQEKERFDMLPGFKPMKGAEGWQLSNAPVFNMAVQRLSLQLFKEAGHANVYKKGKQLSAFFFECLRALGQKKKTEKRRYAFEIITPEHPAARGCQLSLKVQTNGKQLFKALEQKGIIGDWRAPDVIRLTAVPLYNSFEEVYRAAEVLCQYAYCQDHGNS